MKLSMKVKLVLFLFSTCLLVPTLRCDQTILSSSRSIGDYHVRWRREAPAQQQTSTAGEVNDTAQASTSIYFVDEKKDIFLEKIIPLDGEDVIEATKFLIGNLSEFRRNAMDYLSPFLREIHNQTDNLTDTTVDFLEMFRLNEFKAGQQSLENVAGAAYQAMIDFDLLSKSVYSGVTSEVEDRLVNFKKFSDKSFQRGLDLLKMSQQKMDAFQTNAEVSMKRLVSESNGNINWVSDRYVEQNIMNPRQIIENTKEFGVYKSKYPEYTFQNLFYQQKRNQDVGRKMLDSKEMYTKKNIADNVLDFNREIDWGLKPLMASVKPVQEHLLRTKAKFLIDVVLLEKEIESIISLQRNDVISQMWKSILRILKQSEVGLANTKEVSEINLKSILYHLGYVTSVQPGEYADQVFAEISLDVERSAVEMEELAAALRMIFVSDITLSLFVLFLMLWPVILVVGCLPKISKLVCRL